MHTRILYTILGCGLALAGPVTNRALEAQETPPSADSTEPKRQPGEWQIIPFALPFGSSDVGNGVLGNVILSGETADGSGENTIFLSGASTDTGLNIFFAKGIFERSGGWIFSGELGLVADPKAAYFGRGNNQDLPEIKRVQTGREPIPGNLPASPTFIEGRDASFNQRAANDYLLNGNAAIGPDELNPGREVLRQQQNRYYSYSVKRQIASGTIQKWLGDSPFLATLGFTGARTRAYALGGDRESGEFFQNSTTLLELDQPVGFDENSPAVFSNTGLLGIEFNTLPEERDAHPNSGFRTGVRYEGAGKASGSHFTYGRATAYHHHYLDLFTNYFQKSGRELVLAHRAFAAQTYEDIPFFEEQGLGGVLLRGYPGNQFVDRVMLGGSLELRFTAFPASSPDGVSFGFLAFADSGRVAPTWHDIDHEGWHHAIGGGFDVIIGNQFAIELVMGQSRFQEFFILSVGHTLDLQD